MLSHEKNVDSKKINHPEVKDAIMKVLVGPDEGWDSHVMREFVLKPGGFTPKHGHDWPHINYVLKGKGTLFLEGKEQEISEGSIAYVEKNETHQFKNTGDEELKFICIVPKRGHTF